MAEHHGRGRNHHPKTRGADQHTDQHDFCSSDQATDKDDYSEDEYRCQKDPPTAYAVDRNSNREPWVISLERGLHLVQLASLVLRKCHNPYLATDLRGIDNIRVPWAGLITGMQCCLSGLRSSDNCLVMRCTARFRCGGNADGQTDQRQHNSHHERDCGDTERNH